MIEISYLTTASGDAGEDGSCSCWTWTQAIADGGESRYAYADASGWWMVARTYRYPNQLRYT